MNYARVKLTIIWRFFFWDRKVFTSRHQRLYNDWVRLLTTWNRPAKMRSPLNGALGIKLTDSPLAHGMMSVLLPQPGRGLALIYTGMVSGSNRWKEWNEIQEHLLLYLRYLITQGTLCWKSQGISVPSSGPFAAMFCLVCGLLRLSPTCLVLFCLPIDEKPQLWASKSDDAQRPNSCESCTGPAHRESWYIL